jgi:hypothetical protein
MRRETAFICARPVLLTALLSLAALGALACIVRNGKDDGSGTDEHTDSSTADAAAKLAHYCESNEDCDGGVCLEVMCVIPCDGPDWDLASCPEGALCHQGYCYLICDDYVECPLDSEPPGSTTGGYMCGGPNSDYSGDYYTCYLHPEDPGG